MALHPKHNRRKIGRYNEIQIQDTRFETDKNEQKNDP